jgi:hypothetical protein
MATCLTTRRETLMAYIRMGQTDWSTALSGCGAGCNCAPCRNQQSFGEWYVPEEEEPEPAPAARPSAVEEPRPRGRSSVSGLGRPFGIGSWFGQPAVPQIDWCQMRQTIAAAARAEEASWTAANGQKILESNPSRLPILTSYWAAVPGVNAAAAAALSAADNVNWPWSAAFICFVMRRAGVLPAHGFQFGSKHITYIVGALRNRERSDRTRPFWLVDHIEIQQEAIPKPGDILCFNRCIPGGPQDRCEGHQNQRLTTHTYASLRRTFWPVTPVNREPWGNAHSAIVVGNIQIGAQRFVETIGGNETNSVRRKRIPVDQNGGISNPDANHIFGMIRITGC